MEELSNDQLRDQLHELATEWTRRFKVGPCMLGVPFPRGQIRSFAQIQARWPYLPREKSRNIACTIQLCDVNSWFLNTWKVSLTAGSEFEWQCMLPVVAVMESLLHGYGTEVGLFGERTVFKKAINKGHNEKLYGNQLRDELHIHRNRRNDIHLFLKAKVGLHEGKPAKYNQAVRTLRKLETALSQDWEQRNA